MNCLHLMHGPPTPEERLGGRLEASPMSWQVGTRATGCFVSSAFSLRRRSAMEPWHVMIWFGDGFNRATQHLLIQLADEEVRMAKTGRPGLSREKRIELWERWKSGHCASDIARALARTKGAIHHVLAFNGESRR